MFEPPFQHYLSYGSTDQTTVRELSTYFTGLVVPGTIAAVQSEGTKGFVLTLSARSSEPYVIDSRFPLFQNRLTSPKKSHLMLADLLGTPNLVRTDRPLEPGDLSSANLRAIAQHWIDFNTQFDDVESKTFDKYAARLGETIFPSNRQLPQFVLPPYAMSHEAGDGWSEVSDEIWTESKNYAQDLGLSIPLRRVIAAGTPELWGALAADCAEQDFIAWVSPLDELTLGAEERLTRYAKEIALATSNGHRVFALYGGFLSVLFGRFGLTGSSHGIGFGEHRDWVELPQSGAPLARFYVPRLHRYVSIDIASALWRYSPALVECDCQECGSRAPEDLDYHELMKHSVVARSREIAEWVGMPTPEVVSRLDEDFETFSEAVENLAEPARMIRKAEDIYPHLAMWAHIIEAAS